MQNSSDDFNLLELDKVMKRTYAYVAANTGKIIAILTLAVTTLVTFTDVTFSDITSVSFTSSLIIMLIASYLIYFSMEDAGERFGEESEEFKAAKDKYIRAREQILSEDIRDFRDFLTRYAADEAEYRRLGFLASHGYGKEDYAAYKDGADVKPKALLIFKKCDSICPVKLTPSTVLSHTGRNSKSELSSPEARKIFSLLLRLIPSSIGTFFTVSIILTAKDNLSAATVIEGIMKLAALPIIGFKGAQAGYCYAKSDKLCWIETKTRIIEAFLSKKEKAR